MASADRISAARSRVKMTWTPDKFINNLKLDVRQRLLLATEYLRSKVVTNISKSVVKTTVRKVRDTSKTKTGGPIGSEYQKVIERSKPGEYPRADTTTLLKSIFGVVEETTPGVYQGKVGTPLEHGAILELSASLDRSYLKKTFNEELDKLLAMIKGKEQ